MSLDIKVIRKRKDPLRPNQTKADISRRSDAPTSSSVNKMSSKGPINSYRKKKYIWWLIFVILLIGLGLLVSIIVRDSDLLEKYTKNVEIKSSLDTKDSKPTVIQDKEELSKEEQNASPEINLDSLVENLNALDLELEAFDQFNTVELESMQNILSELK